MLDFRSLFFFISFSSKMDHATSMINSNRNEVNTTNACFMIKIQPMLVQINIYGIWFEKARSFYLELQTLINGERNKP